MPIAADTSVPPVLSTTSNNNPLLNGNMMLFKPSQIPGGKGKGTARMDHSAICRRIVAGCILVTCLIGLSTLSHHSSQYLDDAPTDHHRRSLAEAIDRTLFGGMHFLRGSLSPGRYVPVSCDDLVVGNTTKTPARQKKQAGPDPHNPFWVSLHNDHVETDSSRWDFLTGDDHYQRSLSAALAQVVQSSPPGARVLDVGTNTEFSTLLAASQGRVRVDSFEPSEKHRLSICESLRLNQWRNEYEDHLSVSSTVNLYALGVGREEEKGDESEGLQQIVTLDQFAEERGWFDSRARIAVLKVGNEDHEHNAILGAAGLLRAHMIQNIFMEASATSQEEINFHKTAIRLLDLAGYKLKRIGGWKGPQDQFDLDLEESQDLANKIIEMTLNEESKRLNLQWTL